MPAPLFGLARAGQWRESLYIQFGGLQTPIGNNLSAGNLAYIDLNDGVNWFAQGLELDGGHILDYAQYLYRLKAGWTAEDYAPVIVKIPYRFEEGGGQTHLSALATLLTAGQQYLTFDAATGLLCKLRTSNQPKLDMNGIVPLRWNGVLEFVVLEPFFKDLAATSPAAQAAAAGANNYTYTYPGSIQAEPVFTLTIPSANTAVLNTLQIQNTDSGEAITLSGLSVGSGAHTIVVDSGAMKATVDGTETDIGGSFPDLYPVPGGGVNHITVTITLGSGTISGWTFGATWTNRWAVK